MSRDHEQPRGASPDGAFKRSAARTLGIAEVAERTGLSPPVLRMWEARYGHPAPQRLANGRRRYGERDVEALQRVVRERAAGLSLEAAIRNAFSVDRQAVPSIISTLRRDYPHLPAHRVSKRTLIGMSHALEDEYAASGERALLFGAFQRELFFRRAERRWRTLARTAELAVVFAQFDSFGNRDAATPDRGRRAGRALAAGDAGSPLEIALASPDPLLREWAVICDGPVLCACICAWELPGQEGTADLRRRFEATWSAEPEVVRSASRAAWELALRSAPELAEQTPARLSEPALPGGDQLRGLTGLTNRMLAYVSEPPA